MAEQVSLPAVERAAAALVSHISSQNAREDEKNLLGAREEFIWLVVSTKRMPSEKKLKPLRIPLTYPLVDPRVASVCLITKDPQREYKDLLEAKGVKFISRVVGVTKFKGKFKPFEARRQLLNDHGLFLADERVVPMLPALLGKMFFDAKKQPVPVCITKSNMKSELEKAVSSTYMHQNKGTCTSIKIASSSSNADQVVKNLVTALPSIVTNIPEGWNNIQSLHIKTSQSVSLPIWTCGLGNPVIQPQASASTVEAPSTTRNLKRSAESTDSDASSRKRKPSVRVSSPSIDSRIAASINLPSEKKPSNRSKGVK